MIAAKPISLTSYCCTGRVHALVFALAMLSISPGQPCRARRRGGSTLAGRDLGGNLHFTSAMALGSRFGAGREFARALRLQHTSNGGLSETNPGLDGVALNFTFDVPDR